MKKWIANKRGQQTLALVLALVLVLGGVAGGTVAWLVAQSKEVVNTFTYGDIDLKLDETDPETGDREEEGNEYEMMPGMDIDKDPVVTVLGESEDNWLFVKLEKSANFDDFMTYVIADGWTQLCDEFGAEVEGVYYRFHGSQTEDVEYHVLKDDKVTVAGSVTKEMLNELDADPANPNYPTLTVTAYAVQYVGFEPEVDPATGASTDEQVAAAALIAWNTIQAQQTNP